jgi:hypothetical protein
MNKTRVLLGGVMLVVFALIASLAVIQYRQPLCTMLGCGHSVSYSIPDEAYVAWGAAPKVPLVVEICLDDECLSHEVTANRKGKLRGGGGLVAFDRGAPDLGGVYVVTLKVTGPSGMVRYARTDSGATLTKYQPNGRDCDPICGLWHLALEPEDLGLLTHPGTAVSG